MPLCVLETETSSPSLIGTAFRLAADREIAVTCNHVVQPYDSLAVGRDGITTPVTVLTADSEYDIAVLTPDSWSFPPAAPLSIGDTASPDAAVSSYGYGSDSERTGTVLFNGEKYLFASFDSIEGDSGSPVVAGGRAVAMAARSRRWGDWVSMRLLDWLTTKLREYTDADWLRRASHWFAREARAQTAAVALRPALSALDGVCVENGQVRVDDVSGED